MTPHTPDPTRTRAVALAILAECERRGCAGCSLGDAAHAALDHLEATHARLAR